MKNNDTLSVIEIDALTYHVSFSDFGTAMAAYCADYPPVCFQPWHLADYLSVIGLYLTISADGLTLNVVGFSKQVLSQNQIPAELHAVYAPLALWWVTGGGATPVKLNHDTYQLGKVQAQLKPWCYAERLTALGDCQQQDETGIRFDLVRYLTAMLKASVISLNPPQDLERLDSAASCALLSAVLALNIRTLANNPNYQRLLNSAQTAANVLKLCRALGWTPSQVLSTSALEMDWLMALMESAEGKASAPQKKPNMQGLAAYSDAVVIQIEDD